MANRFAKHFERAFRAAEYERGAEQRTVGCSQICAGRVRNETVQI
jgi:hypothetical protein